MTIRRNGQIEKVPLRPLLELMYKNIDDFGPAEFRDFAAAKSLIERLSVDLKAGAANLDREIEGLRNIDSWYQFYRAVAGHGLLSDAFDVERFLAVWKQIWGFDVSGLLEAGSEAYVSDEGDSEILTSHLLGKRFMESQAEAPTRIRQKAGDLRDHHVHFGQFVDIGLLWHAQLRSLYCTWSKFRPRMTAGYDSLEETKNRQKFTGGSGQSRAAVSNSTQRQTRDWALGLAQCRLLLFFFEKHRGKPLWDSEKPAEFMSAVFEGAAGAGRHDILEEDPLARFELDLQDDLEEGRQVSIGQSIRMEKDLLAKLRVAERRPVERADVEQAAFAAAYLALKNAAIARVCSLSVRDFKTFSNSLAVLQNIYDQDVKIFRPDSPFVAAARNCIHASQSFPADLRFALRPTQLNKAGEGLRTIGTQWKAAARGSKDGVAGVVLALHRRDLERYEFRRKDFVEDVLDKLPGLEEEGFGRILGFDLIGSEVEHDGAHSYSSTDFLFASTDFVLDLREEFSERLGRELFVTLHFGEHVCERALGILTFATVLTDPRLRPNFDRFSHALILPDADIEWKSSGDSVKVAREAALGRLVNRCERPDGLLDKSSCEQLVESAKALTDDPDDYENFARIRDLLRGFIEQGHFAVEVCPYSNEMIRRVDARRHPWSASIGKARILLGTDDPSLTQTQPWIEAASFYHDHRP